MIKEDTIGPKITEADIERVEANLGVRFPDDYRAFLLQYNGCDVDEDHRAFPFRRGGGGATIDTFYGIGMVASYNDLERETLREWNTNNYPMKRTLVAIGNGSSDNIICLGVAGEELNEVFSRDMERLPPEPPTKPWAMLKGYIKVADSFTEFLSLLGPYDEISRDW